MPALMLAAATVVAMALALVALARSWPHSSRHTGYRLAHRDEDGREEPTPPEDDNVRWRWTP